MVGPAALTRTSVCAKPKSITADHSSIATQKSGSACFAHGLSNRSGSRCCVTEDLRLLSTLTRHAQECSCLCQECTRHAQEYSCLCQECTRHAQEMSCLCQECTRHAQEMSCLCQECTRHAQEMSCLCQECTRHVQEYSGLCQHVTRQVRDDLCQFGKISGKRIYSRNLGSL